MYKTFIPVLVLVCACLGMAQASLASSPQFPTGPATYSLAKIISIQTGAPSQAKLPVEVRIAVPQCSKVVDLFQQLVAPYSFASPHVAIGAMIVHQLGEAPCRIAHEETRTFQMNNISGQYHFIPVQP